MAVNEFYQVGGWRGHYFKWFEAERDGLLRRPSDGSPLQLVLGITPSGASYLLLPLHREDRRRRRDLPYPSTRYASLSPISFNSVQDLEVFMEKLRPKKASDRLDTSPANKRYSTDHVSYAPIITGALATLARPTLVDVQLRTQDRAGLQRDFFEHARLLYRVAQGSIDSRSLPLYTIGPHVSPLTLQPTIVLFSATRTPILEKGRLAHSAQDELVLRDYGWAVARPNSKLNEGFELEDWTEMMVEGVLSNADLPESFPGTSSQDGEEEYVPFDQIREKLAAFFKSVNPPPSLDNKGGKELRGPTIVITCGMHDQLRSLAKADVPIDDWEIGLTGLFDPGRALTTRRETGEREERKKDRERSRSPVRNAASSSSSYQSRHTLSSSKQQPSSPDHKRHPKSLADSDLDNHTPTYVLDLADLYERLPGVAINANRRMDNQLRKIAQEIGIEGYPTNRWCAGRDVELLGKLWTILSAGSSIDQRGPEVCQLIEQAKFSRQSAPAPSSPEDKKSQLPSSSTSFQYALGAGEVERAAPVVQKEYDPYEEIDDGYDPYDDDD